MAIQDPWPLTSVGKEFCGLLSNGITYIKKRAMTYSREANAGKS
jgi:hypothetical protein